jgi:hypothetical protein
VLALPVWLNFNLVRIDRCFFANDSHLEWLDTGFTSYVALMRTDHRYNNPVFMVFLEICQETLRRNRIQGATKKVQGATPSELKSRLVSQHKLNAEPEATDGASDDAEDRALVTLSRSRIARNRWRLARMLLANPALQVYRASAIAAGGVQPTLVSVQWSANIANMANTIKATFKQSEPEPASHLSLDMDEEAGTEQSTAASSGSTRGGAVGAGSKPPATKYDFARSGSSFEPPRPMTSKLSLDDVDFGMRRSQAFLNRDPDLD